MLVSLVVGLVFVLGLFLSLVLWAAALARLTKGLPLLTAQPHRTATWGAIDIALTIIALFGLSIAAMVFVRYQFGVVAGDEPSLDAYRITMWASAFCSVTACLLSIGWVTQSTRARLVDLGLTLRRAAHDIALGTAGFLLIAPVVFGIQMALVQVMGPTQHPFILLLQKTPDVSLFLLTSLNAVLIAPVVEEYFFRALLQGWFESLYRHMPLAVFLFGRRDGAPRELIMVEGPDFATLAPPVEDGNPYAAPNEPLLAEVVTSDKSETSIRTAWGPIAGSAALFALAHVSHGPDGVPLFVLALGLGYLYQKTHRLLPCITIHFLLNATSMALLYAQLFLLPQAK